MVEAVLGAVVMLAGLVLPIYFHAPLAIGFASAFAGGFIGTRLIIAGVRGY